MVTGGWPLVSVMGCFDVEYSDNDSSRSSACSAVGQLAGFCARELLRTSSIGSGEAALGQLVISCPRYHANRDERLIEVL